ncbi:glycosyltransferase family 4 protein [Spirosoma pomorum]
MKKVLISAYSCVPDMGSEEGNGWYYSSLVSQQGYQVWCLTRDLGKSRIEQKLRTVPHPNLNFVYVTLPRWAEKAFHWGLVGMYFHYIYWQWTAWRMAKQLDQQHPFDLVHHVSYTSLQLGSFMYKLGRPFIYGPVGGGQETPASMRRYFGPYWWKEQLRSVVSQLLTRFNPGCYRSVQSANYLLVRNEDTRRLANTMGRVERIEKEIGGVGEKFIPSEPIHRPVHKTLELVWVGRLMPRKGLELSLHGLSKVDSRLPVHLTIVGDGEMGQYIPDYLKTYQLGDRVTWVGKVSFDQIDRYYRQADAFYFTSLRDTQPAQVLEAMAYSLPVVTLDLHGQADLVSPATGIRVPVTDSETVASELARAIEWLYHNPEQRTEMGQNAYDFARQKNWSAKVKHVIRKYYNPLIEQGVSLSLVLSQLPEY